MRTFPKSRVVLSKLSGQRYQVLEDKAVPDDTYFLTEAAAVRPEQLLLSRNQEPTELSIAELDELAKLKGRPAVDGWILADFGEYGQLVLVEFAPRGMDYLMSFVLAKPGSNYKWYDFAAVSEDGDSVWRVDDGGEVYPQAFPVTWAALTDQGLTMAISWAGPEGEGTFYLWEDEAELGYLPPMDYRYWAP